MAEESGSVRGEVIAARSVPVRELARSAGALLSEVEQYGKVFAVRKYGEIVALLVPVPQRLVLEFDGAPVVPTLDIDEPDADEVELSDVAEEFLCEAASTPTGFWQPSEPPAGCDMGARFRAIFDLERQQLLDRSTGFLRITRKGRRVAQDMARTREGRIRAP